jgi:hypothetical protein
MTKHNSLAIGCKLLGVYFVTAHFGTLVISIVEAMITFRAINEGNVPVELNSFRAISVAQSLGMVVIGCLLIWQTDWCIRLFVANDRPIQGETD